MIDSCSRNQNNIHIYCRLLYDEAPFGNQTNIQILLRNKNDHSVTGDLSGCFRKEFQLNKIEKKKRKKSKENNNNNTNVWSAPSQSRLRVTNCSIGKINGDEGELVYDYSQSLIKTICCFICNRGPSLQRMSTKEVIALYQKKRNSRRPKPSIKIKHIRNVSGMKHAFSKHKRTKAGKAGKGTHRMAPSFVSQSQTTRAQNSNIGTTMISNNVHSVQPPPPTPTPIKPSMIATDMQIHRRLPSNMSQSASNNMYNYNGYRSNSPVPITPNQSGYGNGMHHRIESTQSASHSHSGNGTHRRYDSNQSVPPNRPLPNLNSPSGSSKYRPTFGTPISPSTGNGLGGPQSFGPIEEEKENDMVGDGGYLPFGGINNPDDEDMYDAPDVVEEDDENGGFGHGHQIRQTDVV